MKDVDRRRWVATWGLWTRMEEPLKLCRFCGVVSSIDTVSELHGGVWCHLSEDVESFLDRQNLLRKQGCVVLRASRTTKLRHRHIGNCNDWQLEGSTVFFSDVRQGLPLCWLICKGSCKARRSAVRRRYGSYLDARVEYARQDQNAAEETQSFALQSEEASQPSAMAPWESEAPSHVKAEAFQGWDFLRLFPDEHAY